jgi:pyruvate dehydrogenase E1 component alpha subunit
MSVGTAYASKYRADGRVTVCYFGDGAVSIGGFHEGLSLAALWDLPIVFICENNEYAMGTPLGRELSVEDISLKAESYGIARERFFAEDVLDIAAKMQLAVDRARKDSKPSFLEIRTYRFRGHSMSDPGKYRTSEELESHKKKDPMVRARIELIEALTEANIVALEAEVESQIQDAVQFANDSPEPTFDVLEPHTYAGPFAR